MVVWKKPSDSVRAIIELKRAWNVRPLRDDRDKITDFMAKNDYVSAGYLLAYTEAEGDTRQRTLSKRLNDWADKLDCTLVGSVNDLEGDGEWSWATGLYKIK